MRDLKPMIAMTITIAVLIYAAFVAIISMFELKPSTEIYFYVGIAAIIMGALGAYDIYND